MVSKTRRIHAYVWSGIIAAAVAAFCIVGYIGSDAGEGLGVAIALPICAFAFASCLILGNNFIGEMVVEIFSWGFVRMPGLIFTLDLDGIIWLLTVKLLFWVLGILLALLCGTLAVVLGAFVSVFVYPFALYRAYRGKELVD
ncbi:MAG: hypothetical protein E7609_07095 [Ruminococcaceae bacterium]|nr:hypothetical protein [Oscillospiraceae bacterium]